MPDGSTFLFEQGAVIRLPQNFTVEASRNTKFRKTPFILTVWVDREKRVCYFELDPSIYHKVARIGIFVPCGIKPGDRLSIDWVNKGSAKAWWVRKT